jgi:PIF1-like helicase/Helix-turn-helix domain/HRDC domain
MTLQTNPQLELAFEYVRNTNKHLFLTGKAGSGKTTFLHQLRNEQVKRMAVVAPTGVAAINAGGMTIHSLFQIPIGLHLPGVERKDAGHRPRMRAEKIRLIRSLDLLVIDEISMVRGDLLDAVDEVLRQIRNSREPFGGVQLLMIGDLHQLPPVVRNDDWDLLGKYYDTPYFFSSHALRKTDYISIELKHIYRQADQEFINLLNSVRNNRLDEPSLRKLNSRFAPDFHPPANESYITLTATNAAANEINQQNLHRLGGKLHSFQSRIIGEFPPASFPTDALLEFRVGAQVMFIRNDTSSAKSYFNGKLGRIASIEEDLIFVQCDGSQLIAVATSEWQNIRYTLNEETRQIQEEVLGSFFQYPLRLAWAITIHKSQGLTFERCIVDAQAAFASGQVYVALSRCKSLEGIVLRSRIQSASVKTDPVVQRFSEDAEKNWPTESQLFRAKHEYQSAIARDLFQFGPLADTLAKLLNLCGEHATSLLPETRGQFQTLQARADEDLVSVADRFAPQLEQYLADDCLPEANAGLQARVQKAALYFQEKLAALLQETGQLAVVTDNRAISSQFARLLDSLARSLTVKLACFAACQNGFSPDGYCRAQVNAQLDFDKKASPDKTGAHKIPKGIPNSELYRELLHWREETAAGQGRAGYEVIPNATLKEMVVSLPVRLESFGRLPGIGKARLRKYGKALVEKIRKYCEDHKIESPSEQDPGSTRSSGREKTATGATSTRQISFELFRSGKNVGEIAAERKLTIGTITGHLAHFVGTGELEVFQLLEPQRVEEIESYFLAHPESKLAEAKTHFGDMYEYSELRMVTEHLRFRQASQAL